MEDGSNVSSHETQSVLGPSMKKALLLVNCTVLSIGSCGGPLIHRLYFIYGGKRIWLSSWLLTAGWPLILIVLIITFYYRRANSSAKLFNLKPRLILASAVLGVFSGVDGYLFSYGVAKLPVSTTALITSLQLVFTAVFAYFLVKQKFSSFSVNAVFLLAIGSGVLALNTSTDRPEGESIREYVLGFIVTVGGTVSYGLIMPLIELTYQKAKQVVDYQLVMEIQLVMCLFATLFCTVGMLINKDFEAMPREARNFELGETKYYVVLVCTAMMWQLFFLGVNGVILCGSSLLSGIIITVLLPVIEILAVIFYDEKFQAEKGVALVLSLWGFLSYFYGEFKHNKKMETNHVAEMVV
ncbi:putative purine permease [Heracleum sosnowskyi]|uniref:Probable purine permease n=1 Tax=Heracleum sosnowskyi TaxID=360622 RepID=A0AAD8M9C8_9APIA|nr:putative purine permease [Heracleum sosnowskyi]KAK1367056.1 putative purine permease [Heracleum sosnowskyi]